VNRGEDLLRCESKDILSSDHCQHQYSLNHIAHARQYVSTKLLPIDFFLTNNDRIMATQSLVVSRDPEILGVLGSLMSEVGMEIEVCPELPGAIQSLNERKFDTVIVDCDQDKDGFELLTRLREDERHQKMVAVGITSDVGANQAVFKSGATFVLNKPLPVEDARRILLISNGIMTRAVRRFMRLPVDTLAVVSVDDRQEGIILNVSQKGLAIQTTETLTCGQIVYVSFLLPDTFDLIESMAQVMWVDVSGRAGIEFRTIGDRDQESLSRWVWERARRRNPELAPPPSFRRLLLKEEIVPEADAAEGHLEARQEIKIELTPISEARKIYAGLVRVLVDLAVVGAGVLLFFCFGLIVGFSIGDPVSAMLGLVSGIVFWAVYRFLFAFFRVETVGNRAEQRVTRY
jgi:CheY-like chemotaxis protein